MKHLFRSWKNFIAACEGIAATEFALAAPILLILFLGSVEVARFVIVNQKVEKTAFTISDVVAQQQTITTSELNTILTAAGQIMKPYNFGADGSVIITAVQKLPNVNPTVLWQYTGGGTMTSTTQVGSVGGTATLPYGFTMEDNETVIISEVYYNFRPVLNSFIIGNQTVYRTGIFKPRLGDLTTLN